MALLMAWTDSAVDEAPIKSFRRVIFSIVRFALRRSLLRRRHELSYDGDRPTAANNLGNRDLIETIHWHSLHPRYLGPDSKVLDLGANRGEFTSAITQRFGCHCVAVEPTPELFARLPAGPKISKIQAAVSATSGVMPFYLSSQSVASSLQKSAAFDLTVVDVPVFSLADLLACLTWSRLDLLKVDIEGAEIAMLHACPDEILGRIAQITIEFHDFCGITPTSQVEQLLARLRRLGFSSVRMSRVGHQDTWLINRRLLQISTTELLFTRYVVRNWQGLKRLVARQFRSHLDRLRRIAGSYRAGREP